MDFPFFEANKGGYGQAIVIESDQNQHENCLNYQRGLSKIEHFTSLAMQSLATDAQWTSLELANLAIETAEQTLLMLYNKQYKKEEK